MKRTALLSLYAFLSIVFLHAQDGDTSITISHFQYPETEGIPIIFDEMGENTYYLDVRNPEFISDLHIHQVQLDGSSGIPLGSYFLPDLLPKSTQGDSIRNHSQIYYRKGDYDYSDLGIGLQIELSDSGLFSLQGFKRSPPQIYQSKSNELQNHLFSYRRKTDNSSIAVDALYHIENYNLPVFQENINRQVESFHGGLWIKQNWEKLTLSVQPAFQFSHINRWSTKTTNLTAWNTLNSEYHLFESISLIFDHHYKMITTEKDNQTTETALQIFFPAIRYNNDRILLQAGVASHDSSVTPEGLAMYKWKNYYLSARRNYNVVFRSTENNDAKLVPYSTDAFNIGYDQEKFNSNLEILHTQFDVGSHLGVIGKADINLSWLNVTQSAGVYNLGIDDFHIQPLDMFSHTTLIFSPNVWLWKSARYQPFIGVESLYMQHSGKFGFDPMSFSIFDLTTTFDPFSSYLMNLEMGLFVSGFKVSYRWVKFNVLDNNINNSINPDSYPIQPIRHLEVVWQFLN